MADDNDNVPEHDNKDDNGNEGNDPNDRAHQPEGDASLALLADAVLITYRPSRIILGWSLIKILMLFDDDHMQSS